MAEAKKHPDNSRIRFLGWILQSLLTCLWSVVLLHRVGGDSPHWKAMVLLVVTIVFAAAALNKFCERFSCPDHKKLNILGQKFKYGIMFGLTPPHEKSLADNSIARPSLIQKDSKPVSFQHYLEVFFLLLDAFVLTIQLKLRKLRSFLLESRSLIDVVCMVAHYALLPWLGIVNWIFISWIGSIHLLGDLLLLSPIQVVNSNKIR